MVDVLRLYARPYDPTAPVICLDERPVVLHDEERAGTPIAPGRPARTDYEYIRKGTANIFCIVEPKTGRRLTHSTSDARAELRTRAVPRCEGVPEGETDPPGHRQPQHALREVVHRGYGMRRGRALWRRFKVHYTPKHASWLNAAEMEASLVARQCLGGRRIPDLPTLRREVRAWRARATHAGCTIRWRFRVADARRVLKYDALVFKRSEH
jgi:hypothetical protein